MTKLKRATASFAATALVASGLAFATNDQAFAAPGECVSATDTITLLGFNDFHGRILTSSREPWTGIMPLATAIEEIRATAGSGNVAVISAGDNIGATIFESMVTDDNVSIEVLNALGIDASAVGNHELDKGWADLSGRVSTLAEFPYLAANMHRAGGIAPVEEYTIVEKAGLKIAIVGAVTESVPGLVSPAGITGLTFSDPAAAVNRVTEEVLSSGEADIVVASIHEGATDEIVAALDERIAAVFTGHTHEQYVRTLPSGAPVVQARSYAEALAQIELSVDAVNGGVCDADAEIIRPLPAANLSNPVVAEINGLVTAAQTVADAVGTEVIGQTEAAISTPTGNADVRNTESPMTNMVAQMFFEVVGEMDADNVIGIQNPGGTRASFDAGPITYKEAANTLPFANSLFTTQLTGAQVKQVLEEQWQRDAAGVEYVAGPGVREFLQVGLSDNVSYTYDASLPLDERVTSVSINGEPIDQAKLYTMVSGSFLISGGDQFYTFADGINTADAGRADLEAWVGWVEEQGDLAPDYSKRGVAAKLPSTNVLTEGGAALTFEFSNLDMTLGEGDDVSPPLANESITAIIGDTELATAAVSDGETSISVKLPAGTEVPAGDQMMTFVVMDSGTLIDFPVTVRLIDDEDDDPAPGFMRSAPYTLAGEHDLNGRKWRTTCEDYSQTERCRTDIWATTVQLVDGKYVQTNGWAFNNLTYLPAKRSLWGDNPLANPGDYVSAGREWRTECGTPATGRDGCRSYIKATVVEPKAGGGFMQSDKFIFNNLVIFSQG